MQHLSPTPAPSRQQHALALLLRQRDLQPLLAPADVNSLRATCRQFHAAAQPVRRTSTVRRHAELLAAQIEPRPGRRREVGRRLVINLVGLCREGPVTTDLLAQCRDLIWQARHEELDGAAHETQLLGAAQRRHALAMLHAAQYGGHFALALEQIDCMRKLSPAALGRLIGGDAVAAGSAASVTYFGYGTLQVARRTAPEVAVWWGLGGYIGPAGAAVFATVTGGCLALTGGAAVVAYDVLARRLQARKPELAAVPYDVGTDLRLCLAILGTPGPGAP